MMGIGITAVFGFVSYIISWGIFVPQQLQAFNLLAAASAVAGFPLGRLTVEKIEKTGWKAFLIIVPALLFIGCTIAYIVLIQRGSADVSDIVVLAVLISTMFFSLSFLLPVAGVSFDQKASSGTQA